MTAADIMVQGSAEPGAPAHRDTQLCTSYTPTRFLQTPEWKLSKNNTTKYISVLLFEIGSDVVKGRLG